MIHFYYLLLLLAIVLIFAIILYLSRKRLKRTNAMLETSYNILEMSNNELLEANQELIKANARAEESSKMKTNFIQQISHEIRTPLNILSGFAQLITSPEIELDKEELDKVNKGIVENTERITRLVNKMLELSDASSCAVIEQNDVVPALQVAAEAIDAIGFANPQGFDFDFQLSSDAETVTLQTNLRSAVRALTLILGNAHKFAAKERPLKIVLRLSVVDDKVEYAVEDNGIGVPQQESEHIFEEFVQLDEFYEGTGIGLTVARSIARRLGGDIVLDTTYSPGARFVLSLPIIN
jgi:signal transduction histidine kinase